MEIKFRGKGMGKRLLQELEQQIRIAGNEYCILDSQHHAESFYFQHGYLTVSVQPFEDAGIMHVRMQKAL